MSYTSTTKSWKACGKEQRRECIAFAVFTKLGGLGIKAGAYVNAVRIRLVPKINLIKDFDVSALTNEEKVLRMFGQRISEMGSDVKELEAIFPVVEKFLGQSGIEPLSTSVTFSLIRNKQLSKLIEAIDKFKWTGSSTGTPSGKTEDVIGVPDSLLESLMTACHADGLLSSWLASGDSHWKKLADTQIEQRKEEIKRLKRSDPRDSKIAVLEREIKTLEQDWKL
jgi:hypothetical protein